LKRVAVIGTSGAGKTTVGRSIAGQLDVPFIELDALHWGPDWTEATADELRARVEPIVASDAWVIDGAYRGKIGDLVIAQAEVVVWLDLPVYVWFPRLFLRTLGRIARREAFLNGNRETVQQAFFSRDSLLLYALRSHRRRRRLYPTALEEYNVVRLRSRDEVELFLRGL
jgi:adenylate kinase family enzyme